MITRPIEKEINTITGVDKILSTSVQGYSTIQVKFDFAVTPEEALREVKDAVDKAMGDKDFPRDLPAEPNVFEMNFWSVHFTGYSEVFGVEMQNFLFIYFLI